jgi:hypothetical protein
MIDFSSSNPTYVGFCGPAGSGKTSTAKTIVPSSSFSFYGDVTKSDNYDSILWDHFWFAMPLYEISNYRLMTEGMNVKDRIMYGVHEVLNNVMQRRISYDDLIELVYDVYAAPCVVEGTKPRSFLQSVGSMCRNLYKDCFTDYIKYKVYNTYKTISAEYERIDMDTPPYLAIISDVRMPNEAAMIKAQSSNLLIKFTASEKILKDRLMDRDGILLTSSQSNHESEKGVNEIPDEWFDLILDTSDMTVEKQAQAVKNFMKVGING